MSDESQVQELVYTKAKLGRRLLGHFMDIGILFLASLILYAAMNSIVVNTSWYKSKNDELTTIKNDSGLYIEGVLATSYVLDDEKYPTNEDKKNELSGRILSFYQNPTYFSNNDALTKYNERRLAAKGDGVPLFKQEGEYIIENAVEDTLLYQFYEKEIEEYSVGYLVNNLTYLILTKLSFFTSIVEIVIVTTLNFVVLYLVFPLTCFKRGRQTIGMKLEKIGLISVRADNVRTGVYIGRFFFMYFVFLPINFVSFLIPSIVSTTMMYLTKTNSSLPNYIFNDYMVDVTDQDIYLNILEIEESKNKVASASIENRDFKLK
ncbi:MAG: hypothetical protein K5925_00565 [Bacilli bacterium]|nr:hypothetical protein [Bacilli bacterium]